MQFINLTQQLQRHNKDSVANIKQTGRFLVWAMCFHWTYSNSKYYQYKSLSLLTWWWPTCLARCLCMHIESHTCWHLLKQKKKKKFYKSFVTPGPQNQSHASILRFIHQLRAE